MSDVTRAGHGQWYAAALNKRYLRLSKRRFIVIHIVFSEWPTWMSHLCLVRIANFESTQGGRSEYIVSSTRYVRDLTLKFERLSVRIIDGENLPVKDVWGQIVQ